MLCKNIIKIFCILAILYSSTTFAFTNDTNHLSYFSLYVENTKNLRTKVENLDAQLWDLSENQQKNINKINLLNRDLIEIEKFAYLVELYSKKILEMQLEKEENQANYVKQKNISNQKIGLKNTESKNTNTSDIKMIKALLDNISNQHSTILTIVAILIGFISFVALGGSLFIIKENKTIKKNLNKIVEEFESDSEIIKTSFENEKATIFNSFNEIKETMLLDFESQSSKLLRQFDHMTRINRLTNMLDKGIFDQELFYSDLSQLSTHPSNLMDNLTDRIKNQFDDKFDDDILVLVNKIIDG